MLDNAEIIALCRAEHGDPYAVLGMHTDADGGCGSAACNRARSRWPCSTPRPAKQVAELKRTSTSRASKASLKAHPAPPQRFPYRLRITWENGVQETDDPYRFPDRARRDGRLAARRRLAPATLRAPRRAPVRDRWRRRHRFRRLGAGRATGQRRRRLQYLGRPSPPDAPAPRMRGLGDLPARRGAGAHYKYEIRSRDGHLLPLKSDPYGFEAEMRPSTASIVCALPPPSTPRRARPAICSARRCRSTKCIWPRGGAPTMAAFPTGSGSPKR
jgi:1,4-alpha-glucan branching enzyme